MRLRFPLLVSTLTLMLLATGTFGASASVAPAGTQLPLTGFRGMVADPVHGHVFITGSAADSAIVVRNNDGTAAGTITGESGAGGMVLDGGNLYVARCGWGVIDVIDTATLVRTGSIAAASVGGPCNLALAAGRFWYTDGTGEDGTLFSVPENGSAPEAATPLSIYGAMFASTPVHPDWLVVGNSLDAPTIEVLDVSGDPTTPTQVATTNGLGGAEGLTQLAISPDGDTLYLGAPGIDSTRGFLLPQLETPTGLYPLQANSTAVAVSPDGTKVAGGGIAIGGNDVSVFDLGSATPRRGYNFGDEQLRAAGLLFNGDGSRIFAISKDGSDHVILHVLSASTLQVGSVSLKRSAAVVTHGRAVKLTAHLGTASANRSVSIYAAAPGGGTPDLVKTGTVNAQRNLILTLKPAANTIYTAVWSGDDTHDQATSSGVRVNVRLAMHVTHVGGYRTVRGYRLYHYTAACRTRSHRGCAVFVGFSTPLQYSKPLKFTLQALVRGRWRAVGSGSPLTGANGKLALIVIYKTRSVVGINQRVRFSAPGDGAHVGNTSAWSHFRITG